MIPQPKGPTSSSTVALAAAARSTAAAVEALVKMASEKGQKPTCLVMMQKNRGPTPRPKQGRKPEQRRKSGQLRLSWTTPLLQHPVLQHPVQSPVPAPLHI